MEFHVLPPYMQQHAVREDKTGMQGYFQSKQLVLFHVCPPPDPAFLPYGSFAYRPSAISAFLKPIILMFPLKPCRIQKRQNSLKTLRCWTQPQYLVMVTCFFGKQGERCLRYHVCCFLWTKLPISCTDGCEAFYRGATNRFKANLYAFYCLKQEDSL